MWNMKVVCERILNPGAVPAFSEPLDEHPRMAVGDEYVVSFIRIEPRSFSRPRYPSVSFALVRDELHFSHGMWPYEMFRTTSTRIPSNWVAAIDEDGYLAIAPAAFLQPFFWERVQGDMGTREERLAAIADYKRELEVIFAEA
jgi:hypothetical protein